MTDRDHIVYRNQRTADSTRVVIAFDLANKTGWAVMRVECNPTLIASGTIGGSNDRLRRRNLLQAAASLAERFDGDVARAYLEEPFHPQNGSQQRASWKLRTILGWYEMACELYRWPIETVEAQAWRRGMFGKVGKGMRRDKLKRLAVSTVASMFSLTVGHDEAEAIMIAAWGAKREWIAQQRNRGK